jgi:hypothetical protein
MNVFDKKLTLHKINERMVALKDRMDRDFSGGLQHDVYAYNELKYWKELIERGGLDIRIWTEESI